MSQSKTHRGAESNDSCERLSGSGVDTQVATLGQVNAMRRRLLKATGAGMAAPLVALSAGSVVLAADEHLQPRSPDNTASDTNLPTIDINLFSSRGVIEDSLLLRNNQDTPLVVRNVRPALVVYNDRYIDLRKLTGELAVDAKGQTPLVLPPRHTVSFLVYSQPLYGQAWSRQLAANTTTDQTVSPEGSSYLWANDSISMIGDDAVLVSATAIVVDGTAFLSTKPGQPVARDVSLNHA